MHVWLCVISVARTGATKSHRVAVGLLMKLLYFPFPEEERTSCFYHSLPPYLICIILGTKWLEELAIHMTPSRHMYMDTT